MAQIKLYTKTQTNFINSEKIIKSIIKHCPKKNQDDRPKSEQQWCLYTKDKNRLLGRHPTKEDALNQEKLIQIRKHKSSIDSHSKINIH